MALFVAAAAVHAPIGLRTVLCRMDAARRPHVRARRDRLRTDPRLRWECGQWPPWCCHERARLAHRANALWIAALVHRLSGLALAAFLPLHFLTLGLAIEGEARLEGFLRWSDRPVVKLAETILVFLLAIHMLGGLRLLVLENLGWLDGQKQLALLAAAVSAVVAFVFLARVF